MRTFHKCHRVMDVLNVRVWDPEAENVNVDVAGALETAWREADWQCKMNASVGCLLAHKIDSDRYRYFHASPNEGSLLNAPVAVGSLEGLRRFTNTIGSMDIQARALRRRPNTEWRLFALTNISFYLYKMTGVNRVGNAEEGMPSYLLRNKHVLCLLTDAKTGEEYDDNLCFFRCLALAVDCRCSDQCSCVAPKRKTTKELFHRFLDDRKMTESAFYGINESDLLNLERIFDVSITVFALQEDGTSDVLWNSKRTGGLRLNANLHDRHFCYIKNLDGFCKSFKCSTCESFFTRASNARRHICDTKAVTQFKYETGVFGAPPTVWEIVEKETGINVPPLRRSYPYWMTYDIESVLLKQNLPAGTATTSFHNEHQLVSVSLCSNIPGYTKPVCFVRETTVDECVRRFVNYAEEAATKAEALLRPVYRNDRHRIVKFLEERAEAEKKYEKESFSNKRVYEKRADACGLLGKIDEWMRRVPLVGFNSQRYDLNVMKAALVKCFCETDDEGKEKTSIAHVVKKQDALACIITDRLRIVDMINVIGPGYTYDGYLKAFGVSQTKGFFPYEWLDDLEKLKTTELPPIEAFCSVLRGGRSIERREYEVVEEAWKRHDMKTVKDLLIWYNNLDVEPFVEAIDKQRRVYLDKGIDMLKDAFSAPGISVLWLNAETGKRPTLRNAFDGTNASRDFHSRITDATVATLRIHKFDEDGGMELYNLFRQNLVGGPSIVFHRLHEKGVTRLREREYGDDAELCESILGLDANALYLHCLSQDLPVGMPKVRLEENKFAVENGKSRFGKSAQGWLAWREFKDNVLIERAVNGGERRLGRHNLPVDGFCQSTSTVYQFHGCFWHGHDCGVDLSGNVRGVPPEARLADTFKKEEYLKSLGYRLKVIWECQWSAAVKSSREIRTFLSAYNAITYGGFRDGMSVNNILERVKDGRLFGFVECDVSVPEDKVDYFSEMSPVFKNVDLSREHLSPHMSEFAKQFGFLKQPQRYLVGSLRGDKILVFTELLRWYLEKGLTVTRVYKVIEYERSALFKKFGASVTAARRAGDADPSLKLVADTNKLIGNSAYGKLCQDKSKHKNVTYSSNSKKASTAVRSKFFHSLNPLDDDTFEISSFKRRVSFKFSLSLASSHPSPSRSLRRRFINPSFLFQIKMDTCTHIGFTVLQYAKLWMLMFHFDFLDR